MEFPVYNTRRLCSSEDIKDLCKYAGNEFVIITIGEIRPEFIMYGLNRMVQVMHMTGASIVYSDYIDASGDRHVTADWQLGAVREDFDMGPVWLVRGRALESALSDIVLNLKYASLYKLRLDLTLTGACIHVPEVLYRIDTAQSFAESQFGYVDRANDVVQMEMSDVFSEYLKKIGAWLPAPEREIDLSDSVRMTVVIPVLNRVKTVKCAIESALSQNVDIDYNIIVVDNHSTDGTSELVRDIATKSDGRVVHIIPEIHGLGIGGCWNRAITDYRCGDIAVQLDSDDMYEGSDTLQKIIDTFRRERCAMVVGSYTLTDFDGQLIPPGLISHREWTAENGHNNLLRVNGIGAPRAFFTPVIRDILFPDTSYGEDYAMALAVSREWKIGRIFTSVYYCRRWSGNSDAGLSPLQMARNNAYKDALRTWEIEARRMMNVVSMNPDLL